MIRIGFFFLCLVVAGSWGCRPDDTDDATQPARDSATPAAKDPDHTAGTDVAPLPTVTPTADTPAKGAAMSAGQEPGPTNDVSAADLLLLGSFRSREYTVHVYTGQRYTIETADGQIVGELLTEEEFAKRLPVLLAEFRGAIADDGYLLWGRTPNDKFGITN
jgi:hypothetical protein